MIAATPAIPICRAEVLNVRLGPSDGAAGTIYYPIIFTNTGPVRCSLTGYPGVSSVDAQGRQIGAPAEPGAAGSRAEGRAGAGRLGDGRSTARRRR